MNSYLLESNDEVALQKTINELIKKNNFEEALISTYDLEESSLSQALEDLDTYSFLSPKKVVIIRNIETINPDSSKKELEHLYNYVANALETNLLIVVARKLNNTLKFVKDLKKNFTYLKCEVNLAEFIKDFFKDYTLESGVVRILEDYCNGDISKLSNECHKLKDFAYQTTKIMKKDVYELVEMKLGDSRDLTFAFVRSLAEKNKQEALKDYKELLNYNNTEPLAIIGLIASQIRIMYQVKVLEKEHLSNKEIALKLGEKSDYRIAKTKELTHFYSEEELLKLMIKLEEIDFKSKTQDVDYNFLIDMFIINM